MNTLKSINTIAGREVEVTIRSDKEFTLSFDCIDKLACKKIVDFFKGNCQVEEDEECGTFIYITA